MNSIFKKSKLDEMQEIKLLKIEHYGFWAMYGGLLVTVVIQAAQGAELQQYAGELVVLLVVLVGVLIASLWAGIWDRRSKPTAGGSALAALVAAILAGAMNYRYLPGALMVAGFTWVLTFSLLQACAAIYKKRNSSLNDQMDQDIQDTEENNDA